MDERDPDVRTQGFWWFDKEKDAATIRPETLNWIEQLEQLEQVQEAQGPQVDQDAVDELMQRYNIDEELATRIQLARESGIDDETIAGYLEKEGIA